MTKLLLRLFVKGAQNPDDPAVRLAVGKLAGVVGILCNGLLCLGKVLVGTLSGSVAIVADGVNNLSDAASSVVTLLGFRMAQQPADADHPYGHARYEYISGLVVAALILVIGADLAQSSVEKILSPEPVDTAPVLFGVLIGSILVKLWMSRFFAGLGRHIQSTTLQATSVDSRNDVIASAAVLAGCLVEKFAHLTVDGYVGLAVAAFILWSGVGIARETISPLLGQGADRGLAAGGAALRPGPLPREGAGPPRPAGPRLWPRPVLRLGPRGDERPGGPPGLPRHHRRHRVPGPGGTPRPPGDPL